MSDEKPAEEIKAEIDELRSSQFVFEGDPLF